MIKQLRINALVISLMVTSVALCHAAEDVKFPSKEITLKATTLPDKESTLAKPAIKTPLKQTTVKKKPKSFKAVLENGKTVQGSKPAPRAGLSSSAASSPQLIQMPDRYLTMPTRLVQPPQQPAAIQRLPEIIPLGPAGDIERIDAPLRLDWER